MIRLERLAELIGHDETEEARASRCQACGHAGLVAFYEATSVPAQTCVLLDSEHEASAYPRGSVLLGFCEVCGFIQNIRFDSSLIDYSKPTEESQAFSPTFTLFAEALADELVDRYQLEGKRVLEIGCGKGDFLQLLASRGIAGGVGIDPGFIPNRDTSPLLTFEREWYRADDRDRTADLVLTRHLMEHVPNVSEFFGWLRASTAATPGAALVTEVPDTRRVLGEGAFWDVYHEHCSYFTLGSLARALRHAGMNVEWLRTGYADQYLLAGSVVASPGSALPNEEDIDELGELIQVFARTAADAVTRWRAEVAALVDRGERVAIWGGGSKAVAFVTTLGLTNVTVVDINPHKQDKWLPGTSIQVESPGVLAERRPALVIPMNPIYVGEITGDLNKMGLSPRVVAA